MNFAIGLVTAAILIFIIWSLRGMMLLPVRTGENTAIRILLHVSGEDRTLEQTLDGLIWLRENGTLKSEIIIVSHDLDDNTRHIAEKYAEREKRIKIIEDGDCQWSSSRR